MTHILDTNIILAYLKKSEIATFIEEQYGLLSSTATPFISAVTVGELWSISIQNNWGVVRQNLLVETLRRLAIIDINIEPLIQAYALIDAFSQNKLPGHPLNTTARNMGKNDLWIAATASFLDAPLITTDKDFNHLHNQFVDVIWLDLNQHR